MTERFIVGVDLGGTTIVAGAMPVDGSREIGLHSRPTLAELGADVIVDRIVSAIDLNPAPIAPLLLHFGFEELSGQGEWEKRLKGPAAI